MSSEGRLNQIASCSLAAAASRSGDPEILFSSSAICYGYRKVGNEFFVVAIRRNVDAPLVAISELPSPCCPECAPSRATASDSSPSGRAVPAVPLVSGRVCSQSESLERFSKGGDGRSRYCSLACCNLTVNSAANLMALSFSSSIKRTSNGFPALPESGSCKSTCNSSARNRSFSLQQKQRRRLATAPARLCC